ncbi:unnamed protein product, partial [marine sediment metagenome]
MHNIKVGIRILSQICRNPKSLARVLEGTDDRRGYVIKKYGYEYGLPTVNLLDLFP